MDIWHKALIGALGVLAGTVAVLWKENRALASQNRADMKAMFDASTKLGFAVAQKLARPSGAPAPGSNDLQQR